MPNSKLLKVKAFLKDLNIMTVIKVFFMAFTLIYIIDLSSSMKVQKTKSCLDIQEKIKNESVSLNVKHIYDSYCGELLEVGSYSKEWLENQKSTKDLSQ